MHRERDGFAEARKYFCDGRNYLWRPCAGFKSCWSHQRRILSGKSTWILRP